MWLPRIMPGDLDTAGINGRGVPMPCSPYLFAGVADLFGKRGRDDAWFGVCLTMSPTTLHCNSIKLH